MSLNLPAMFDPNPLHTFDKIMEKQTPTKKLSNLDLDPKIRS